MFVILRCGVASSCVVLRCVALKYGVFRMRLVRSDLISTLCDISKLIVFLRDIVSCMLCCSACVALFRLVLFVVHRLSLLWVVLVCFVSFCCLLYTVFCFGMLCLCSCWFALFSVVVRCEVPVVWIRSVSFSSLLLV